MDDMFVLRKKHFDNANGFWVVKIGEKVDGFYGSEFYTITQSDLEALKAGKVLASEINEEYAIFLKLEEAQERED